MKAIARGLFAGAVATLAWVAACGGRSGLLDPEIVVEVPDSSLPDVFTETGPVDVWMKPEVVVDALPDFKGMCTPHTCAQQGFECGENGDGCGGLIQCGTCTGGQVCGVGGFSRCGGGFGLGPDGGPLCTPQTCASLHLDCGPAADGCGGVLQCGTCQSPLICGAAGTPNRCGSACSGLCLQQVQCESGTTSISGKVVAGTLPQFGAPDPIYNALVYVPNAKVQPFPTAVTCSQCGGEVSGLPLVETQTGPDGTFTLNNVPVGTNIPLVIQLGRWRRQVVIPSITACTNNAITTDLTRLPRNKSEGDVPKIAIATGFADALECVLMKMGVDQAEFTNPGKGGRVEMFSSNGAIIDSTTPPATTLWNNASGLSSYDQVLLPCEGQQLDKTTAQQQNIINYTSGGGRIFATHYSYTWLYNDPPFQGMANWNVTAGASNTQTGIIDTTTATGKDFATWLALVGALSGPNQMTLVNTRWDVDSIRSPAEQFIYATSPQAQNLQFDFLTPVGQPPTSQCGRVIFSDFHVIDQQATGTVFPGECAMAPMTAQEKALEFMMFNLASCVPGPQPPCQPQTCANQGINCGPAGDGCGKEIMCGSCMSPQSCGGGGGYGQCGYPDAGSCTPKTCQQLGYTCGQNGDGCGGVIDCGSCTLPAVCGGGGKPNQCGF